MQSPVAAIVVFLLGAASLSAQDAVDAPETLEDVAITFVESGWNNRTWERRSYLLRRGGVVEGLWVESGAFASTLSYRETAGGTYEYRRLAEVERAELVLSLEGNEAPLVKQLRFFSNDGASVLHSDIFAHPESMRIQRMGGDQELLNLSNRAEIYAGGSAHTGFVLGKTGLYLIRVVGPTLKAFGVTDAVDAVGLTLHFVGDTTSELECEVGRAVPPEVLRRAAEWVGAFPLGEDGQDVAIMVRLYPGTYVAEARNLTASSGQAMIELYALSF